MKDRLNKKQGFTLIEVLIAMSITVIIVGTISSMVMVAYRSYYNVESNTSVVNGVNSVTETVRELTFDTTEVEISQLTAAPTFETGYDYIYSLDNTIYLNGGVLQSAEGMGVTTLSLEFAKGATPSMLSYTLQAIETDGSDRGETMSAFLNACDSGIAGDATGNCIKFVRGEHTGGGIGGGAGGAGGGGGGGTPVPETPTEATTAAPVPEAPTEATTVAPVPETSTEATTAAPVPEEPTETTTTAPDTPSGGGSGTTWEPGDESGIVTGLGEETGNNRDAFKDVNGGNRFTNVVKVPEDPGFTINVDGPSKVIIYICADDNADDRGNVTAEMNGSIIGSQALASRQDAVGSDALVFEVDSSGSIIIDPEYKALLYKIEIIPK